ncbi:hypothetical protein [Clostridium beijerinckii]|uniref:hypothetical protein n=1 Tax=Clostridium beijerinckii TaxID=1520 RepID=UPI0015704348|nr:hypothetical protein [Clostridium beijerinckii]NRW85503.1 septation ring formation regulator EzrA [Clostridium beijerinckii]
MKDKSIAIQCDEMTQGVMKDLQQAMESAFSRTSESLSEEIVQKLEPINSSLNKLRKDFSESNEENVEKLDELIEEISNISKSIKSNIEEQVKSILKEQAQAMETVLVTNTQEIKDIIQEKDNAVSNKLGEFKKDILNEIVKLNDKIDDKAVIEIINNLESNFNDRFNSMREELRSGKEEIISLNTQSAEDIVRKLENKVDKMLQQIRKIY